MKSALHPSPAVRWLIAGCLLLAGLISGAQAQVYEKVFSFTDANASYPQNKGSKPNGRLIRASDGNFYGTTVSGGSIGYGTVFKMTPAGGLTTLVEFTVNGATNRGSGPMAGLVQGSDGSFYGTTFSGGSAGFGTVFRMTPSGVLTTLAEFTGNGASNKGAYPWSALIAGNDGNFYGTTQSGGVLNLGTIYKITPAGVLTTLVEFTGNGASNKGSTPLASLVQGSDGNFYGTAYAGGANNLGTVFKMTPAGVLTTLLEFTGNGASNKGSAPAAGLVQGSDGNFYGTTATGGTNGFGTVFKATPAGALTTLVHFTNDGAGNKGSRPAAELALGSDGNFYGTTVEGGSTNNGTAFRMTPAGGLTTLVNFSVALGSNNGSGPKAGLVLGGDGNFYGTTEVGGPNAYGTVFKLSIAGTLTTLVAFTGNGASYQGSQPQAGLLQGSDGNFYGTTYQGGANNFGTVFKVSPAGILTILAEFTGNVQTKGSRPYCRLALGTDGNFYGTTEAGGSNGQGTVFRITPGGVFTSLVDFTDNAAGNKGSGPFSGLVRGTDGNFYGTTSVGGSASMGTVYKMTPAGVLTTLVEFTGVGATNKGREPWGSLVQGTDGNFYGMTSSGGALEVGTIFKMTPAGVVTDLLEFTGSGPANKGSYPFAELSQGTDGNFYGTTAFGGANDLGTVFKVTPAGVLTTLVEFTGNGASNKGAHPQAGLVQGSDGNFYGTTLNGGLTDRGTVFKVTPAGVLTTLLDFSNDPVDSSPRGRLIFATNGNLYGTASGSSGGGHGSVFRFVYAGVPEVALLGATGVAVQSNAAVVVAKVNARGSATTCTIEYGADGVNFPNTLPLLPSPVSGYLTTTVEATLSGLTKGSTYYYRVRATSSAGTTLSAVASFATLAEPVVTVSAASSIAPVSAQFNGTVNARNYDTTLFFEYGTDGNTFPTQVDAVPASVTGSTNTAVSAAVAGLTKGTTYYYRIKATNAGGTTISGTMSFVTLTDPVATVGPASAVTASSAKLNGFVNAKGALTSVTFEYGSNGVSFPNSVGATPSTVSGSADTAVSAVVTGLSQGATYYYRVKGTSAGGVGVSSSLPLTLDILSGFSRTVPGALPPAQGFVFVTLLPSGIASGWRFVGEQLWRPSTVPVGGLATGDREIEYRPVPGYIQPLRETVSVISGGAATLVTGEYFPTTGGASGGLSVVLKPSALADLGVPVGQRAQWRLLGENDAQWRNSGVTINGLIPGNYLVECKPVAGRTPPPPISVPVQAGATKVATATYTLADASAGTPPAVLPFESVNSDANLPYAFVGQLRNDVGSATGFVVKARVVATAAHVVFDDGTLSYVTGLQWLFQRHSGTFEPKPQIPRGFYVFNGYAAQRTAEGTPGQSTPQSQNLDAAALYFLEDAGRGGFGGYLGSDSDDNEFLLSTKLKLLAGYPVDGITAANQGRMHTTPPANVNFAHAFGHTFTTADIRSSGGNSGGPLCVQFDDGKYYAAAIYLGGSAQTVVRSIDSGVIDLFNRAEVSGNGGGNNTSGGISQVNTPVSGTTFAAAAIKVDLLPAAAANGGATWKLSPTGTAWAGGTQLNTFAPGDYSLYFTAVPGFLTPPSVPITLTAGNLSSFTQTYNGIATQPSDLTVAATASANFTVGVSGTPTGYQWRRNGVNIAGATAVGYTRTNVTLADTGNYSVVVTWSNGAQTSNAATLSVNAAASPPAAPSDFDGDGRTDLLWRNTGSTQIGAWASSGTYFNFGPESGGWALIAVGDFDGDGQADVLWHNTSSGIVASWTTTAGYQVYGVEGGGWAVIATGDFDGDGKTDVLWHNTSSGIVASWTTTAGYQVYGVEGGGWAVIDTGDFDGDDKADVLWHNTSSGIVASWTTTAGYQVYGVESGGWAVITTGDFDGDGQADVLWHNTIGLQVGTWTSSGAYLSFGPESGGWQVIQVGDFDGDGKAEPLWRNSISTQLSAWTSSGAYLNFGPESGGWQVVRF